MILKKEKRMEFRLDTYDWWMLDELTKKLDTTKSKLIRLLIEKEYEEQCK